MKIHGSTRTLSQTDTSFTSWTTSIARFFSAAPSASESFIARNPGKDAPTELYRRISPIGDQNQSVIPVLDQWIEEGKSVDRDQLLRIIKELRFYKRFSHALEISFWMSNKRYFWLTQADVAIRLDLMTKVHGLERAENYFNNIPQQLKGVAVYGALLNCYAHAKSVKKAEAIYQRMRELGLTMTILHYNVVLNLYCQTGNIEKLGTLMQEMDKGGTKYDKFTYSIVLGAYASASDVERMEKMIAKMEADPDVILDCHNYTTVATGYQKAGLLEKAFEMLRKSERWIPRKRRHTAYDILLTQYAALGKKDEVFRIWELYKKNGKVYNVGYISMIASLLNLDDIESAEKVFEDWELQDVKIDMRIPNFLIGAYSRKGLLEKAESIVNRTISKGGEPDAHTWYYLATGYLQRDQIPKGVEMMKKAMLDSTSSFRKKPSPENLVACLEYLKGEGVEEAEEFINLLRDKKIISLRVRDRLLDHMRKDGNSDALHVLIDNFSDSFSD